MKSLILGALVAAIVALGVATHAIAATPTPSPAASATPSPEAKPPNIDLRFDDAATFSWPAVDGAANYQLTGSLLVVRVNAANPICTPPIEKDSRDIPIDVTLPSTSTSYKVPLPDLPPEDRWLSARMSMTTLRATRADSTLIAFSGGLSGIVETQCPDSGIAPPLPDDEAVALCVLAPDAIETTSDAARAHGQRTFDAGPSSRYYARSDGSCVSLAAAYPPVPEFAPDTIESTQGVSAGDPPPLTSVRLPDTGADDDRARADLAVVATELMLLGVVFGAAGAALRRRSR